MFCPERSRGEPSKFMSFRYASANLAGTKASLAYSLRLFDLTVSLAAGCRQLCSQLFDAKRSVRFHRHYRLATTATVLHVVFAMIANNCAERLLACGSMK